MKTKPIELNQTAGRRWWLVVMVLLGGMGGVEAQGGGLYEAGVPWGVVEVNALREGSGLSCGWRNEGMVWTQNDGNRRALFVVTEAGVHAGTFSFADTVGDVEEMAAGPGGQAGRGHWWECVAWGCEGVGEDCEGARAGGGFCAWGAACYGDLDWDGEFYAGLSGWEL